MVQTTCHQDQWCHIFDPLGVVETVPMLEIETVAAGMWSYCGDSAALAVLFTAGSADDG